VFTLFVVPSIYVLLARTHKSEAAELREVSGEETPELTEAAV